MNQLVGCLKWLDSKVFLAFTWPSTYKHIAIVEEDNRWHTVVTAIIVDIAVCEAVHENSVNLLQLLKLNHI